LILLMTTAPPVNAPWSLGRKLPPLGLAYVGAALEKAGFQVEILDNYLLKKPIEEVEAIIKKLQPEIVGITCGSATYQRCIETAHAVKETEPKCKVIVGGWHASYMPETLLDHSEVDFVVVGEGEQAMTELATAITRDDMKSSITIPGVAYRNKSQTVKNTPQFIGDLDQVPFPARHLLPMNMYGRRIEFLNVEPVDMMSVTRGCPYHCAWCDVETLWGKRCRSFSPKRIFEEMKHLVEKYGSRGIYFISDNFTIHKEQTLELCDLIKKEKIDIEWACDTRVDLLSRELLEKMKEAGCRTIWFSIESGSPPILEKLNKSITLKQVADAFWLCRQAGIQVACSFMLGIPGETVEDMEMSLKFAKKLDPDWCRFNTYVAYPGSVLYEEVRHKHLYDRVEDYVFYVKTEEFDFEKVSKIQQRFHASFNRSPRRILRKLKRDGVLTTLKQLINL
jgi:anaerobic magnesium-protoporphyrin IX monomethyl ester cyclase